MTLILKYNYSKRKIKYLNSFDELCIYIMNYVFIKKNTTFSRKQKNISIIIIHFVLSTK